ncbi:hypothetical protein Avbf_12874 [Armadillidium vulgare]|nr:hypothetical protein Avbf_12874 [Armadillidium vulgare]
MLIFVDVERVSDSELKEYLVSVPDWNWDEEFMVASLDTSLAKKLDSVLLVGGVSSKTLKRYFSETNFVLKTTEKQLIHRSLPDGFQFGVLKDTQMPYLFSTWKYSEGESIEDFQKFVKIFPTSAVYRKEDKLQSHPISYIFYYHYGFMGMIHTDPEYRRLGLASAVFSNLCSKLAENKILMLTQVNIDNEASFEMHKKLGFEIVNEVCWFVE